LDRYSAFATTAAAVAVIAAAAVPLAIGSVEAGAAQVRRLQCVGLFGQKARTDAATNGKEGRRKEGKAGIGDREIEKGRGKEGRK